MGAPQVTQSSTALSMTSAVEINIAAPPETIWGLLTDAKGFPRWNSTVTEIDGEIRDGARIRIHAPGTNQTFTPVISGLVPNRRMTWTGGASGIFRGVRTFEVKALDDGSTDFMMRERFSGLMFALARRSLPDFRVVFATYAENLGDEAERISKA